MTVSAYKVSLAGSATLMLAGPDLTAGEVRACFRRWGYQKPFLHTHGWDVGECWIVLHAQEVGAGQLSLALPGGLAHHLEENSNYVVTLIPPNDVTVTQPIRWSVSSRARTPGGAVSASSAPAPLAQRDVEIKSEFDAEEQAWRSATAAASRAGWCSFVSDFPNGQFIERAMAHLAAFLPPQVIVQTRWAVSATITSYGVDTCAFLLTASGMVRQDADFISSWATDHATGAVLQDSRCSSVRHQGAVFDRAANVSIESMTIDLDQVPHEIHAIAVTVSLDTRATADLRLESVDATLALHDPSDARVLFSAPVPGDASGIKGRIVLEMQRQGSDWTVHRSVETFKNGIFGLCERFGVATA